MGYGIQVLDRPEGTSAYAPSIFQQLSPIMGGITKGLTDRMYREAAKREGLQSSYKQDASGNWATSYDQPTNTTLDAINKIYGIKKAMKESAIDDQAPKLAKATSYFQKAIEAGGDPSKLAGMVKPERFAYPEQQKEIRSAIEEGIKTKKGLSEAWKPKTKADQLQFESEKAVVKEAAKTQKIVQPKMITPAQALGILSDPFKSAEFRKSYPDQYSQLEKIALTAMTAPNASTNKKTAPIMAENSVVNRVNVLRKTGWTDDKIAEALRQKNTDPSLYGIKEK